MRDGWICHKIYMRVYICHEDNNYKYANWLILPMTIDFIENILEVWNTAYTVDNLTLEVIWSLFI